MGLILALCLWLLPETILSVYGQPVMVLTISPNIWDLIDTKAHVINQSVTSLRIPDQEADIYMVRLKTYNAAITDFHVGKSDVSLIQRDDGIHVRVERVKFNFFVTVYAGVGVPVFRTDVINYDRNVYLSSSDATFDIMLIWDENQFKFIPAVAVNSNIKMDAGILFKEEFAIKHALSYVERRVREEIDAGLSKKLKDLISDHVNPHMQKLKEKLSLLGFHNYDFKWIVEKNALRVIIGHSEDSELTLEPPSDFMMCAFLNIPGTRNLKSFLDHRKKRSLIPDIIMPYGIEISCVDQKFCLNKHGGTMCTNFDFNFSLDNVDRVVGCEPGLPF